MNTKSKIPLCFIVITISAILLSSCATTNTQPSIQNKIVTKSAVTAIETTEGSNTLYLHNGNNKEILCASRGNDFAFAQAGEESFSLSKGAESAGIGEDTSAGIAELGGINAGVLLSREVMYRTCEFMGNLKAINGLTPDVAKELFQNALDAVLKISTDYDASAETGQSIGTISSSAPTEN